MSNPIKNKIITSPDTTSTPGTPNDPINITSASLITAYNNQTLIEGYYLITDKADAGILIQTVKDSSGKITPSLKGDGAFLDPDFQNRGNYTGVLAKTGVAYASTLGVWTINFELITITYDTLVGTFNVGDTITEATNSAVGICISDDGMGVMTLISHTPTHIFVPGNSISNGLGATANEVIVTYPSTPVTVGDIVFWNGLHYQKISGTTSDGGRPQSNPAYQALLKSDTNQGYITEVDIVEYDFLSSWITKWGDKRANVVISDAQTGISSIEDFQRGNDSVLGNVISDGNVYTCINNRGVIKYNNISGAGGSILTSDNTNEGSIQGTVFINSNVICNKNFGYLFNTNYLNGVTYTINQSADEIGLTLQDFPSYDNMTDATAALPRKTLWQTTGSDITFLGGVANVVLTVP